MKKHPRCRMKRGRDPFRSHCCVCAVDKGEKWVRVHLWECRAPAVAIWRVGAGLDRRGMGQVVCARVGETRAGVAGRRGRDEHKYIWNWRNVSKRESRGEKNAERAAGGEFLRVEDKARRGVLGTCALCTEPRKAAAASYWSGDAGARQSHSVMKLFHSAASIGAQRPANGAPDMDYASYGIGSWKYRSQPLFHNPTPFFDAPMTPATDTHFFHAAGRLQKTLSCFLIRSKPFDELIASVVRCRRGVLNKLRARSQTPVAAKRQHNQLTK